MKLMRDRDHSGSKLGRRLRTDPERDPEAPLNSYVRRQEENRANQQAPLAAFLQ